MANVSPGKNRTKRGMKWNRWHPEASLSLSGPGREKKLYYVIQCRKIVELRKFSIECVFIYSSASSVKKQG